MWIEILYRRNIFPLNLTFCIIIIKLSIIALCLYRATRTLVSCNSNACKTTIEAINARWCARNIGYNVRISKHYGKHRHCRCRIFMRISFPLFFHHVVPPFFLTVKIWKPFRDTVQETAYWLLLLLLQFYSTNFCYLSWFEISHDQKLFVRSYNNHTYTFDDKIIFDKSMIYGKSCLKNIEIWEM